MGLEGEEEQVRTLTLILTNFQSPLQLIQIRVVFNLKVGGGQIQTVISGVELFSQQLVIPTSLKFRSTRLTVSLITLYSG